MKRRIALLMLVAFACEIFPRVANSQTRGIVCGDPTAKCKTRDDFQAYELPFDHGTNVVISQSQLFYAVILKSVKLNSDQSNCADAIPEADRIATQTLFPHSMVFVMRCSESGQNSYTNMTDGISFMAVYGGSTLAEANAMLKKVSALGKFKGATVRRMRAEINGT